MRWEEETYRCTKPNQTFRDIAKEKYNTDQYEKALLAYNRDHPRATDALRGDSPVLQAGQAVYIPSASVLNHRYPHLVPGLTAGPAAPATAPVAPAPMSSPAPAVPTIGVSHSSGASPAGARQYTVQADGETLWSIAKQTLGKNDRWPEISQLNAGLDTAQPLPVGTTLKLPQQ